MTRTRLRSSALSANRARLTALLWARLQREALRARHMKNQPNVCLVCGVG